MDTTRPAPLRNSKLLKSIEDPTFRANLQDPIPSKPLKAKVKPAQEEMDPFEVRIRFTQYLQHLNASVTSANKTAQYALKYRDMDEDLHSCILEQLERVRPWFFHFVSRDWICGNQEEGSAFLKFLWQRLGLLKRI